MEELFQRSEHNLLIIEKDIPYPANAVFNAGVAELGDEVLLLLRVGSPSGRSHLIVACSEDGVGGWRIEEPHGLIGRARRWLLSPQEAYERTGDARNVVFAAGHHRQRPAAPALLRAMALLHTLARARTKQPQTVTGASR